MNLSFVKKRRCYYTGLGYISTATVVMLIAGCASSNDYNRAFSARVAVAGSSRTITGSPNQILLTAKQGLVKQGFAIGDVDTAVGIIKASRSLPDARDQNISYTVNTTVSVGSSGNADTSNVAVSANQQTILHRKTHTWWHLLGILPLFPTSTNYETTVTKEGDIGDPVFYSDFFSMLDRSSPMSTGDAAL